MEHRCCSNCKFWVKTRPREANWGFCHQTTLDFAGKQAFIYTFGADFIKHPELRIELQTRDTHYCSMFQPTVLFRAAPGKAAPLDNQPANTSTNKPAEHMIGPIDAGEIVRKVDEVTSQLRAQLKVHQAARIEAEHAEQAALLPTVVVCLHAGSECPVDCDCKCYRCNF